MMEIVPMKRPSRRLKGPRITSRMPEAALSGILDMFSIGRGAARPPPPSPLRPFGSYPWDRARLEVPGSWGTFKGLMAEVLSTIELELHGWVAGPFVPDVGVDIQAYRKGRSLYVQTKCPAELVICDDEVRCQYHIDSRPLLGLRGDDAFYYCLLMVAPGVDGFGMHFAWIGADRLATLLTGSPHRRKKDGVPYEFTLRLRAPLDGSGLYYSYYGKKEYELTDCVDAVPAGARRDVDADDWDGYMKTFSLELRGDIAEKWVSVELLRRGYLPARPQMDAGVDVSALRLVPSDDSGGGKTGSAKWVLEGGHYFQVKTNETVMRASRGGFIGGYYLRHNVMERIRDLDVDFIIVVEPPSGRRKGAFVRERRFVVIPHASVMRIFEMVKSAKDKASWMYLWFSDDVTECWVVDRKGEKRMMELTGNIDAWDGV